VSCSVWLDRFTMLLFTLPLLLLSYYVYQQYDTNDPEGRVTSVKVSFLSNRFLSDSLSYSLDSLWLWRRSFIRQYFWYNLTPFGSKLWSEEVQCHHEHADERLSTWNWKCTVLKELSTDRKLKTQSKPEWLGALSSSSKLRNQRSANREVNPTCSRVLDSKHLIKLRMILLVLRIIHLTQWKKNAVSRDYVTGDCSRFHWAAHHWQSRSRTRSGRFR
jgi:hypothetical protein